jgi:hypothetical protein
MLIPNDRITNARSPAGTSPPHASDLIATLNDPSHDSASRRAFENLLVSELTRRFGDHRAYFERSTREWTLHVVRKRYWSIWAYLLIASVIWLAIMLAGIVAAFAILEPKRTGVSFLFLSLLVSIAVAPLLEAIERRLCTNWVLGLKSLKPKSKVTQEPVPLASQLRDRAA